METRDYQLKLIGINEKSGSVNSKALKRALEALNKTAESTVRLLTTGEGRARGANPAWLNETVNFVISGIHSSKIIIDLKVPHLNKHTTVICFNAPLLRKTADEIFEHLNLWSDRTLLDKTAIDLVLLSVEDLSSENIVGNHIDASVLRSLILFQKVCKSDNFRCEINCQEDFSKQYTLNRSLFEKIERINSAIPEPESHIISGVLNHSLYNKNKFRISMKKNIQLFGRFSSGYLDADSLNSLWGKPVIMEGIVHFDLRRKPRFIEARKIEEQGEGDSISESVRTVTTDMPDSVFTVEERKKAESFDISRLYGTWPGDEPIEELLADLD